MANIITVLTDFGTKDSYVSQMKGVILGIAPQCQLIDITHEIAPQDVLGGARALREAVAAFPTGTIHLAVVDPGVGTSRRLVAAELWGPGGFEADPQFCVLPDNGLLEFLLRDGWVKRVVTLDRSEYWRPEVSSTFHGRDIMAPVAAHLAAGVPLSYLGSESRRANDSGSTTARGELVRLGSELLPEIVTEHGQASGRIDQAVVLAIDHFGNAMLNVEAQYSLAGISHVAFPSRPPAGQATLQWHAIMCVESYAYAAPGDLVMLIGSSGSWEIAVVNGSAADAFALGRGQDVVFQWK